MVRTTIFFKGSDSTSSYTVIFINNIYSFLHFDLFIGKVRQHGGQQKIQIIKN